ncbi:MAG: thiolase family protein [Planctomycetes bacterium]|nr:thiolase family protein [Planctomycetota bacterium]
MARRVAILAARRTPIGRFMGAFKDVPAAELGACAVRAALADAGLRPEQVGELIFGNARQAGGGPNPARQVAQRAGLPVEVTAFTVNKACASGMKSIVLGLQAILLGDSDLVVAGGTESMSRVPFLLDRAREGYRLGHDTLVDGMYRDGFMCPLAKQLMGETAEALAEKYGIPRVEQDRYAVLSQNRCERARKAGYFERELIAVEAPGGKAGPTRVALDEHVRDGVTLEGLAKLPPVFKEGGTVHAGNSSGITDGAAAVILASEERVRELGVRPLAWLDAYATAGVDPKLMGIGPVPALAALEKKSGRRLSDYALVELNEAFAAQVLACMRDLPLDPERVNVNGGSIALGHPIGATGARIVVTLLHEMARRNVRAGVATLCVSGGLGMAVSFVRD